MFLLRYANLGAADCNHGGQRASGCVIVMYESAVPHCAIRASRLYVLLLMSVFLSVFLPEWHRLWRTRQLRREKTKINYVLYSSVHEPKATQLCRPRASVPRTMVFASPQGSI